MIIPKIFQQLQFEGYITESEIRKTNDGFTLVYKSLSDLLAKKDIFDVPDSDGVRLSCDRFFDDWFLYAVPDEHDYVYSLLKLREQEHDAEGDIPSDGDTPGVTISFISLACEILLDCLTNPTDENRKKLNDEINRVAARRGQSHHEELKKYFSDPSSEGTYLVASLYTKHIAAFAANGYLSVPECYSRFTRQSFLSKRSASLARLPRFVESINQKAGYIVCDNEKIYIKNRENPDPLECAVILATHTGNTSVHSFAAEVEWHARFLVPFAKIKIPFTGKSLYDSAIRADMTIGASALEGFAPFHKAKSRAVKRQLTLHEQV